MPIKLPNGKFRVQIRIKGHPPIDRVFDKKKEAAAFENAERERIKSKAPLYTLEMTFREAWEAYRASMLFRAKMTCRKRGGPGQCTGFCHGCGVVRGLDETCNLSVTALRSRWQLLYWARAGHQQGGTWQPCSGKRNLASLFSQSWRAR
jgi:hypothetical protein